MLATTLLGCRHHAYAPDISFHGLQDLREFDQNFSRPTFWNKEVRNESDQQDRCCTAQVAHLEIQPLHRWEGDNKNRKTREDISNP